MSRDLTGLRAGREARHQGQLHHGLDDRRRALEEAFFQKQNAALRKAIRERREHERQIERLAVDCGFHDRRALRVLVEAGLRADTLPALGLTPLVSIAWADGEMSDAERGAILEKAQTLGITPTSMPHALLSSWLESAPSPSLFVAWIRYARRLVARLPEWERHHLVEHFVTSARQIAEASPRGTLDHRISDEQDALLSRIAALSGTDDE